jgi:hypothetical protein
MSLLGLLGLLGLPSLRPALARVVIGVQFPTMRGKTV